MSERRKATTVLWIRHEKQLGTKVELFAGEMFERLELFRDKDGEPITANNRGHYFRLRVDGLWYPAGRRVLFTKNQCMALIKGELFQ